MWPALVTQPATPGAWSSHLLTCVPMRNTNSSIWEHKLKHRAYLQPRFPNRGPFFVLHIILLPRMVLKNANMQSPRFTDYPEVRCMLTASAIASRVADWRAWAVFISTRVPQSLNALKTHSFPLAVPACLRNNGEVIKMSSIYALCIPPPKHPSLWAATTRPGAPGRGFCNTLLLKEDKNSLGGGLAPHCQG